jgi:hypothetical protein
MAPRFPSFDPSIDRWKVAFLIVVFAGVVAGALTWTTAPWGGLLP